MGLISAGPESDSLPVTEGAQRGQVSQDQASNAAAAQSNAQHGNGMSPEARGGDSAQRPLAGNAQLAIREAPAMALSPPPATLQSQLSDMAKQMPALRWGHLMSSSLLTLVVGVPCWF